MTADDEPRALLALLGLAALLYLAVWLIEGRGTDPGVREPVPVDGGGPAGPPP